MRGIWRGRKRSAQAASGCRAGGTPAGWAGERGSIAPLVVVAALVLFAVLAFSVDQGIACAAKVRQENALDAARDACMEAPFALRAKSDDDPGRMVAVRLAESLRAAGCDGAVSVWFYEVPAGGLPASRRVWGIAVQVREESPTVFARGYGIASLPVASKRVIVAEPFASEVAWRPEGAASGRFDLEAGADPSAFRFEREDDLDGYPAELVRAVRAAADTANGKR